MHVALFLWDMSMYLCNLCCVCLNSMRGIILLSLHLVMVMEQDW
jgi:hypothetical protein